MKLKTEVKDYFRNSNLYIAESSKGWFKIDYKLANKLAKKLGLNPASGNEKAQEKNWKRVLSAKLDDFETRTLIGWIGDRYVIDDDADVPKWLDQMEKHGDKLDKNMGYKVWGG